LLWGPKKRGPTGGKGICKTKKEGGGTGGVLRRNGKVKKKLNKGGFIFWKAGGAAWGGGTFLRIVCPNPALIFGFLGRPFFGIFPGGQKKKKKRFSGVCSRGKKKTRAANHKLVRIHLGASKGGLACPGSCPQPFFFQKGPSKYPKKTGRVATSRRNRGGGAKGARFFCISAAPACKSPAHHNFSGGKAFRFLRGEPLVNSWQNPIFPPRVSSGFPAGRGPGSRFSGVLGKRNGGGGGAGAESPFRGAG